MPEIPDASCIMRTHVWYIKILGGTDACVGGGEGLLGAWEEVRAALTDGPAVIEISLAVG